MRIGIALAVLASSAGLAHAQGVTRRYVEELTDGMALPTAPLAGDVDARTVVVNPGGLALVRGTELALALGLEDSEVADGAGQGFGAFWARSIGGRILPRLGIGAGLEWLRPPRGQLEPDPGLPFRFTLGAAKALGASAGVGVAWHHFHADGVLDGVDEVDLGATARLGNYLAAGATVRDLASGSVGGPVQRRYELELLGRPFGSDAFEAAAGGRIGETRHDLDGWLRASLRVARGVYVRAEVESRELHALDQTGAIASEFSGRDVRATFGLELSFGRVGVTTLVRGVRDDAGRNHVLGGELVVRASTAGPASLLGTPDHIERVDLAGAIGARALTALVVRMREIARDPSARAVVVTFDGISGGWATLEELRDELTALRRAGKKLFAYMVSGTGRDYYVASAAHKIYIDPAGGLRLVGIAGTTMYFRGAFEQFGVLPQFEKIAEYKTAPEQFTEVGPTDVAAKMRSEMLDSLWRRWVDQVAEARQLTPAEVTALVDAGPYTAGDLAGDTKLVDAVAEPDKVGQLITLELGEVLPVTRPAVTRPRSWQRPRIAVVYIDGDIADGKSKSIPLIGQSVTGGESAIEALTSARNDPSVAAIVVRIDSPGGSALASELVSREVFATRGVKPIVCSMSDLAASGGYFIAAGCDQIFAEPMTITGSIGIFYGKFDIAGLAGKLGITTDTYKRGKRADVESMFRPYTADERAMLKDKLRYMYGRFIGAVAEGRGMAKPAVDAIGRGHVWTGDQAMPIKLIDTFGGLNAAIDEAKRRSGLAEATAVQLVELPELPSSLFGTLGRLFGVEAQIASDPGANPALGLAELPAVKQLLEGVPASLLVSPGVPQARLPFELSWE